MDPRAVEFSFSCSIFEHPINRNRDCSLPAAFSSVALLVLLHDIEL